MKKVELRVLNRSNNPDPQFKHEGDAGFDLAASEDWTIRPGSTSRVPTGLFFIIPDGYELQIRSRSSMASKGIVAANQPGTIDSGYTGEAQVLLHNRNRNTIRIQKGQRIAQAVLKEQPKVELIKLDESGFKLLSSRKKRGDAGFGSTGEF